MKRKSVLCWTSVCWQAEVNGIISLISKFIPHKDNEFVFISTAEQEWQALKTTLTTEPVITFFDPNKWLKASTDDSKYGLGAVLLQAEDSHWKSGIYIQVLSDTEHRKLKKKSALILVVGLEDFMVMFIAFRTLLWRQIIVVGDNDCHNQKEFEWNVSQNSRPQNEVAEVWFPLDLHTWHILAVCRQFVMCTHRRWCELTWKSCSNTCKYNQLLIPCPTQSWCK